MVVSLLEDPPTADRKPRLPPGGATPSAERLTTVYPASGLPFRRPWLVDRPSADSQPPPVHQAPPPESATRTHSHPLSNRSPARVRHADSQPRPVQQVPRPSPPRRHGLTRRPYLSEGFAPGPVRKLADADRTVERYFSSASDGWTGCSEVGTSREKPGTDDACQLSSRTRACPHSSVSTLRHTTCDSCRVGLTTPT